MSDDIEVPVIEICDGWTVDDVETEDDCDDAFAVLTGLVCSIEARIDRLSLDAKRYEHELIGARQALRWKKAALSVINTKRGQIRRREATADKKDRDEKILRYLCAMHNGVFMEAVRHVDAGTIDLAMKRAG